MGLLKIAERGSRSCFYFFYCIILIFFTWQCFTVAEIRAAAFGVVGHFYYSQVHAPVAAFLRHAASLHITVAQLLVVR